MDHVKVTSVLHWSTPKNVKGVRGFFGLTVYYRKFIVNYGKISKSFSGLTKKDNFIWNESAMGAFDALKLAITSTQY